MKVLKFGAAWCSGCIIMKPRWEKIEKENSWLETEYYDYDKDKETIKKYNIAKSLPVFVFLDKDGEEFLRMHGEHSEKKLLEVINENKDK